MGGQRQPPRLLHRRVHRPARQRRRAGGNAARHEPGAGDGTLRRRQPGTVAQTCRHLRPRRHRHAGTDGGKRTGRRLPLPLRRRQMPRHRAVDPRRRQRRHACLPLAVPLARPHGRYPGAVCLAVGSWPPSVRFPLLSLHRRRGASLCRGRDRPAEVHQPPHHAHRPHDGSFGQGRAAVSGRPEDQRRPVDRSLPPLERRRRRHSRHRQGRNDAAPAGHRQRCRRRCSPTARA